MQQDPVAGSLGQPDSLNRYVYAEDRPVSVVDPSGRQNWECLAAISSFLSSWSTFSSIIKNATAAGVELIQAGLQTAEMGPEFVPIGGYMALLGLGIIAGAYAFVAILAIATVYVCLRSLF